MPDTVTEIDFTTPVPQTADLPATRVDTHPALPQTQEATIFQVIARAASDPTVDIDKLERLIQMQASMQARQAQLDFDNAMAEAQEAMKAIRADAANNQTKSKYATYAALDHAVRPIYSKHGFALSFNTGDAPKADEVRVLCVVSHRGGHRQEYKIDMPADGKGPQGASVMTRTHATGAAASYGQRYLLKLIFNLAVGDVDDDGNGASGDDDDIDRMSTGPRDPVTGRPMSNYNAKKAANAQEWADQAIEYLNLSGNAAAAKDWRREKQTVAPGKKKSPLQWLQDASPGQYSRVANAYENATGEELE